MADSDRECHGDPSLVLPDHAVLVEESKDGSLLSSSTPVVTKCERGEEGLGSTQSLPQTYSASPLLPSSHPTSQTTENLPQTAITTVYASMAQPVYVDSEANATVAMAGHQTYLHHANVSVVAAGSLHEHVDFISGNMPLKTSVGSTVMVQQSDFMATAEPIDFRRSGVSHAEEMNRMTTNSMTTAVGSESMTTTAVNLSHSMTTAAVNLSDSMTSAVLNLSDSMTTVAGNDSERSGVSMIDIVEAGSQRIAHTGDTVVPHIENLGRVTLPQTADISRISLPSDHMHRNIVHTVPVTRVGGSQLSNISKMDLSETEQNIPVSVEAYRLIEPNMMNSVIGLMDPEEIIRRNTPVSELDRRSLPPGHSQESAQGSRGAMSSIIEMSALDGEAAALLAHETDKVWINVPISGQSVPYASIGKPSTSDGSRMAAVPLNSDMEVVNTLNISEGSGVDTGESGNVRTVVLSQLDDFSRINLPNTGVRISTAQSNSSTHMDTNIRQATGIHSMDIKYNDLLVREGYSDGGRISVLSTQGQYDNDRLSFAHLHDSGELRAPHTVDTKPIILPQTGDISIVTYPPEGAGTMAVPQSQTGSISMVILPQTGDLGQMTQAQTDVQRIDLLPAEHAHATEIQTVDRSRMNIEQSGNVIRISLPPPGDVNLLHSLQGDGGSLVQIQQAGTVLPQTSHIQSSEMEDKGEVIKMIASQSREVHALKMQQKYNVDKGIPHQSENIPQSISVNATETQQVYDFRTNHSGTASAAKKHPVFLAPDATNFQVSEIRPADKNSYYAETSGIAHFGNNTSTDRQRIQYDPSRTNLMSQAGDIAAIERQKMYNVGDTHAPQAAEIVPSDSRGHIYSRVLSQAADGSTDEKQLMYDVVRITEAAGGGVDRQHVYIARTDSFLTGEQRVVKAGTGKQVVTLPHTLTSNMQRLHETGDSKVTSAVYANSSMMTLPLTSGVKIVNMPMAEETIDMSTQRQPMPFDGKRTSTGEQPPPQYINMRVMAEAAEILARGNVPADDINMRLMAETADFVSRNVPQTTVINSAGSSSQAQNLAVASTVSSKITHPQTRVTSVLSKTRTAEKSNNVALEKRNKTVNPSSVSSELGSSPVTSMGFRKIGTMIPANPKSAAAEKWKQQQRAGAKMDRAKAAEQPVDLGFCAEFFKSQSYIRWKDIGRSQGLHNDEEIACFLIKYYDNTSKVFPSGRSSCDTCQRQLSVSCVSCSEKKMAAQDDGKDGKKDDSDEKGVSSGDRTKLWKMIVDSAPKEGQEKGKDKPEIRHRRKPVQTGRVLRRRVIASPPRSPEDNSADDTRTKKSAGMDAEKEPRNTLTPMVTRKRGRPSKDSYHQASTMDCPRCKRKFHTAIGLDQHVKRKRCKVLKTEAHVEAKKAEKKDPGSSSFQFQCGDCGKEYRSQQGLTLHRVSKHGEVNRQLQRVLPEEDEGEDTDEYVPDDEEWSPSKAFECSLCYKKYQSKQGLLAHKASKHGLVPDSSIKSETEKVRKNDESGDDVNMSESEIYRCEECDKTYQSRPSFMVHMKTKHTQAALRECPECDGKFKTKVELRIHFRRSHNRGQLILFCPYCPMIFHGRDVLRNHMDDNHKTCRRVLFDCVACDLQFSSRIERKRHIQSEHKGKDTSLTCHFCGNWFATRHEFDEHEKSGHPEQTQEWLCAICGDSFPTRYLLQRHALTHKEKILCHLCNKYITEPCFEDHMKRHYGSKSWKCEVCGKSFIRKAELQQHELVHRNERPFCCEQCGMRYREKSRLNSHMRTHSGIKPYKCEQCDKAFTRSRELKNHTRVHTGEKPFACTVCGRKFASSGNLSAHRRKVHKLEPIPHGQQSRKHTLEESIKPENRAPEPVTLVHQPPVAAHSGVALGAIPVAHSGGTSATGTSFEVAVDPGTAPLEAPLAHSAGLTLQAPLAHQAPVAHQDQVLAFQHQVVTKYEPEVSPTPTPISAPIPVPQPEQYAAQPTPTPAQQPTHVAIYWPNASYGEES